MPELASDRARRSTVAIWAACFADVSTIPDAWMTCLDMQERGTLARLRVPRVAIAYAGRHAMLRATLGPVTETPPGELRFRFGRFGKPYLEGAGGRAGPAFSLSQTGEVAVAAIHRGRDIGIDVETISSEDLSAARLFSTDEQAELAALPKREQGAAFTFLWVCKEAVLKAAGSGLAVAPDRVTVSAPDGSGHPVRASLIEEGRRRDYAVQSFRLTPSVVGAIAADHPVEFSIRWWRRCQRRAACNACTTSLIA